jgi:4-carboxymuconolactone decarboxylase
MSQPSDLIMFRPSDFGTFGRFEETPVANMPADMKDAYDFTVELRDIVEDGRASWSLLPKALHARCATHVR